MKYVEMTIEKACEYYKGVKGKTVLVAVQNLEEDQEMSEFVKKSKSDGEFIFQQAETIAQFHDEFINQFRVFTEKQIDIKNIKNVGVLTTILLKE